MPSHGDAVRALCWLNARTLLTGCMDEAIRVWSVDESKGSAKLVKTLRAAHMLGVLSLTAETGGHRA